jgi:NAD(P)-dependent dehydrogenase (short-subunit alcohol dehydrogenase family)
MEGKVCIVTGGGSGIGEVTAMRYASAGASVAIADLDGVQAQRVADTIGRTAGEGRVIAIPCDVSSEASVKSLVEETADRFGGIDVLFNNAATILPKALEDVTEEEWMRTVNVNLKGVFLTIKHSILYLRRAKGSIVNMASLNGLIGQRQNAVYASTKGGIIAMTKALALDYAESGVRVNCICPAGVTTPLLEKWVEEQADPDLTRKQLNEMHPLGRPATPEEIADAAVFLSSEASRFITGVALPVDGGASLGY